MSAVIDETHDPARTSWVMSANGHSDSRIQNLPLGVFSPRRGRPRDAWTEGSESEGVSSTSDLRVEAGRLEIRLVHSNLLNAMSRIAPWFMLNPIAKMSKPESDFVRQRA